MLEGQIQVAAKRLAVATGVTATSLENLVDELERYGTRGTYLRRWQVPDPWAGLVAEVNPIAPDSLANAARGSFKTMRQPMSDCWTRRVHATMRGTFLN